MQPDLDSMSYDELIVLRNQYKNEGKATNMIEDAMEWRKNQSDMLQMWRERRSELKRMKQAGAKKIFDCNGDYMEVTYLLMEAKREIENWKNNETAKNRYYEESD